MNDKPFLDTNVLVYALNRHDRRSEMAQTLLSRGGVVSVQCLNEFATVLKRKLGMSWDDVRKSSAAIEILCPEPRALTAKTHRRALDIAEEYGYSLFDALVVSSALEANCRTLYSEDMQDGQIIETVTIRNPFVIA